MALPEDGCITSESAGKSARYWAGSLYGDDASAQRFVDGCAAKVNRNVSHAADLRVAQAAVAANKGGGSGGGNGGRNGGRGGGGGARRPVKFARVPVGPTCPFCIMLASRGFVYATAKTAGELGQYHDRCNCRILAGYEGMQVEGYDYEGMYERYLMCRKTVGDSRQLWKDWEGLSDEERGDMTFSEYSTKRMLHEMAMRDRQWLFDGTIPEPTREPSATPLPKEEEAARWLANQGFRIQFRETRSREKKRTSDVFINKETWEIKRPEGNGRQTLCHQFEEAAGQSERIVLDISVLEAPESGGKWSRKKIIEKACKYLQR